MILVLKCFRIVKTIQVEGFGRFMIMTISCSMFIWCSSCSGNYGENVSLDKLKDFHRRRLQVLVEAGPDLLAFETIPNKLEAQVRFLPTEKTTSWKYVVICLFKYCKSRYLRRVLSFWRKRMCKFRHGSASHLLMVRKLHRERALRNVLNLLTKATIFTRLA